ncbi:sulfatase-like hydrolase/transferase [Myxococcus xanthus]|uniref:sulfatase-like hydrolase/transferase n=1 Tax=Myxococcus xanthus TaxID=34 RepID=UPI00192001FD|nr:sulfatase-like hydrolase/transferase [Myxococcus xanthus]
MSSFVNPHDIVFSGLPWFTEFSNLQQAGKLPEVAASPTAGESLESKPRCQKDYVYTYPRMYLPQRDTASYRQFYYFLMAEVSKHIQRVYEHLKKTSFFDNTIVVLTSDHGEMLGAHGGMMQKWYNAYQETLHVPCVISNPGLFPEPRRTELVTSHVDLVPTLLGLAGIDADAAWRELARDHSEAQPLVGRDLSGLVLGRESERHEPIYFMTDDNVESGLQMTNNLTGRSSRASSSPSTSRRWSPAFPNSRETRSGSTAATRTTRASSRVRRGTRTRSPRRGSSPVNTSATTSRRTPWRPGTGAARWRRSLCRKTSVRRSTRS